MNKKNNGLITASKIEKENKEKNDKEKDINLKESIDERKEKDKGNKNEKKEKNKNIKKSKKYRNNSFCNECFNKRNWKRRCRKCNIITIIRDIFITIIILSAIAFYATIFIVG